MRIERLRRGFSAVAIAVGLASCNAGGPTPPTAQSFTTELQTAGEAVAAALAVAKDVVEVTGSRVRLQVSIRDASLSGADQATRERTAASAVSATETALRALPEFATVQAISIAFLHSAGEDAATGGWHTEDVVEYRKGANQRFSPHDGS